MVDVDTGTVVGSCCTCVAVGKRRVGERITSVAVGSTCTVGDTRTVGVIGGNPSVLVGIEVCSGPMLT
jgi:hypothetical protein